MCHQTQLFATLNVYMKIQQYVMFNLTKYCFYCICWFWFEPWLQKLERGPVCHSVMLNFFWTVGCSKEYSHSSLPFPRLKMKLIFPSRKCTMSIVAPTAMPRVEPSTMFRDRWGSISCWLDDALVTAPSDGGEHWTWLVIFSLFTAPVLWHPQLLRLAVYTLVWRIQKQQRTHQLLQK